MSDSYFLSCRQSIAALSFGSLLLAGCGLTEKATNPVAAVATAVSISPKEALLSPNTRQQFLVSDGTGGETLKWGLAAKDISSQDVAAGKAGTISPSGLYISPSNLGGEIDVLVTVSLLGAPLNGSAAVRVTPSTITVTPASMTLNTGALEVFRSVSSSTGLGEIQWMVNGVRGGSITFGRITSAGIYTAPAIYQPGLISIEAASSTLSTVVGTARVTLNPPLRMLTGVTYAKLLTSWNATQLPWIAELSGLQWNPGNLTWSAVPGWIAPANGIGPQIYYLYTALDPATEMAIARRDVPLMEELTNFHLALLQQRSITIAQTLADAPANAYIFIAGPADARTFTYNDMYNATRPRIGECQLCDVRYLKSASRLLWAIAELPPAQRTSSLKTFVSQFSGFLIDEQVLRLLYGSIPWSHWANPNIARPLVSGWTFLAQTGYEPPHPIKYQAAMTDPELWLLADAAEILGADLAAPELNLLSASDKAHLQQAVRAGTSLLQVRSHHMAAPDGADTLSTLAGDYDDHPDFAYSSYTGPSLPVVPDARDGLMSDSMHAGILPPVFQALYNTRAATGASFPALEDVVALTNSFVHLAFNGDTKQPDFNNYLDGWNGYFRVGDSEIPGGYPPHEYCDAELDPDDCMTAGTLQGWGHLATYNPDLVKLEQSLINLAYDDSPTAVAFKSQHYAYDGPYTANAPTYPVPMIYFAGDSAGLIH